MSSRKRLIRTIGRAVCIIAAAGALSGCIIVPAHPHYWHPRYYY